MIHRAIPAIATLAFTAVAVSAMAQTTAPAAATGSTAAPAAVPKPECGAKPGEYPGNLASENIRRAWQKDFVAYIDCLKKFVEEQQALAEPHVKASNAAISEYNESVKSYNDQIQKAKGG